MLYYAIPSVVLYLCVWTLRWMLCGCGENGEWRSWDSVYTVAILISSPGSGGWEKEIVVIALSLGFEPFFSLLLLVQMSALFAQWRCVGSGAPANSIPNVRNIEEHAHARTPSVRACLTSARRFQHSVIKYEIKFRIRQSFKFEKKGGKKASLFPSTQRSVSSSLFEPRKM